MRLTQQTTKSWSRIAGVSHQRWSPCQWRRQTEVCMDKGTDMQNDDSGKEITWKKILCSPTGHRWQYGACKLHDGYL